MANAVSTPSQLYEDQKEDRRLISAVMGGTKTMREEDEKYLPKFELEDSDDYARRRDRAAFNNVYRKTVRGLSGKPFARPIKVAESLPTEADAWIEDADNTGAHLEVWALDFFQNLIADGINLVLVDYPLALDDPIDAASERGLNRRPYLTRVDPRNLIGWRTELRGGIPTLIQARIYESSAEADPDDEFKVKRVERIRVFDLSGIVVTWRLFEKTIADYQEVAGGQLTRQNGAPLGAIPLIGVQLTGDQPFVAEPPLLDLAYMNVEHWQSRSDQASILHVARVPILKLLGISKNNWSQISIGSTRAIFLPNPGMDVGWAEIEGSSIEAGRVDLGELEDRMRLFGMQLLVKERPQTATEANIDKEDQTSELATYVRKLEDGIDAAYRLALEWQGLEAPEEKIVEFHKDFGVSVGDSKSLEELRLARTRGDVSLETYLSELKRYGIVSDTFDVESEAEKARGEVPNVPTVFGGQADGS